MMEGKAGQGKVPYKPEDGQANPDPAAKSRDFAGYGSITQRRRPNGTYIVEIVQFGGGKAA